MDFTQNYRIGIDWDHNGVSCLRHRGRKLISPWPYGSISDPNYMTREIFHVIGMSVTSVTNSLCIGIKTPTVVTIPLHNIAMIPLEPPFRDLQCKNVDTELFEVVGNPLSNIEQPCSVVDFLKNRT